MIDPFVLLTPVLLLCVIALLRFVGCDIILGLEKLVQAPTFDPPPGTYNTAISVTLSAAPGEIIYFSTDGSDPTQMYNGPIAVSTTTTIKALAKDDSDPSNVVSGTYTIASAIGFVQVNSATPQVAASSVQVPYLNAQTAGNLNIVVVGWSDSTSNVAMVQDSLNNYQPAVATTRTTSHSQAIYYAPGIQSGNNTVTVTFDQAVPFPDVRVLEYTGVSALDASAAGSGVGPTTSCGPAITSADNELIFAANTVATGNSGPGADFTQRIITIPNGNLAEDRIVSAIGSYAATATLTGSGDWVMQMATFK